MVSFSLKSFFSFSLITFPNFFNASILISLGFPKTPIIIGLPLILFDNNPQYPGMSRNQSKVVPP